VTLRRRGDHLLQRAGGHDLAAADARPGPEIDDVVGRRIVSSSCSTTITVLP